MSETTTEPAQPATPPAEPQRPDWLPEKFKDPQQLAEAYANLERRMGGGAPEPAAAEPAPAAEPAAGLSIPEPVTPTGEDAFAPYVEEFATQGSLSDESFAKLEKEHGYPRHLVEGYLKGQEALRDQSEERIFKAVGGREQWGKVAAWARANIPVDDLRSFNALMETGTPQQIELAVQGLQARYASVNGQAGSLMQGTTPSTAAGSAFSSYAEFDRALADPKYATDDAYRADVARRLAASGGLAALKRSR